MKTSTTRSSATGVTITGHHDSVNETDVSDATVSIAGNNDRVGLANLSDIAVEILGNNITISANGGGGLGSGKAQFGTFFIHGSHDNVSFLVIPPGPSTVPILSLTGSVSVGGRDDSVLVSFEAGSVNAPVLIGTLNDSVSLSGNHNSVTDNTRFLAGSTAGTSATRSLNKDAVVTGNGNELNTFLQFTFNVVYTSQINVTGNNDRPTENVTLTFGEVAITYTNQTSITATAIVSSTT